MRLIKKIIANPYKLFSYATLFYHFPWMSDKRYLSWRYRAMIGKKIDWENPSTFNEKLQWLKLYDRKEYYAQMVDKCEAKLYFASKIKSATNYLIPTLGVWDSFDNINLDLFPNSFVLKCTHDSGSIVICKDKSKLDMNAARAKLEKGMKRNFFYQSREYPYKNVKPRIIAEAYIEDMDQGQLLDYKIFCFNGKARYLFIASDRQSASETKFDYFDIDFNRLDMRQAAHPTSNYRFEKPHCFDEMVSIAETLSKDIPQLRVDFYVANDKLLFGEMTFFHHGGFVPFIPDEWDYIWGNQIQLPQISE